MIIKSLKHYNPFYFLFAVILVIAFWGFYYFFPISDIGTSTNVELPLYSYIKTIILRTSLPFLPYLISVLLIILQLFIVNQLNLKYSLSGSRNFFFGILFAFFSSLVLLTNYFSPVIFANIFLLLAFYRVFAAYNKEKVFSNFFDASIFISVASLFYINAVFFVLLLFIATLMIKTSPVKEWIVIIIGILIVYAIYFEIYFIIFGNISSLFENTFNTFDTIHKYNFCDLQFIVITVTMFVFFIGTLLFFLQTNTGLNLSTRVFLRISIISLFLTIVIFIFTKHQNFELTVICAFPLSAIGSNYFMNSRSKRIPDISFVLLALIFLFIHIINLFPVLQKINF